MAGDDNDLVQDVRKKLAAELTDFLARTIASDSKTIDALSHQVAAALQPEFQQLRNTTDPTEVMQALAALGSKLAALDSRLNTIDSQLRLLGSKVVQLTAAIEQGVPEVDDGLSAEQAEAAWSEEARRNAVSGLPSAGTSPSGELPDARDGKGKPKGDSRRPWWQSRTFMVVAAASVIVAALTLGYFGIPKKLLNGDADAVAGMNNSDTAVTNEVSEGESSVADKENAKKIKEDTNWHNMLARISEQHGNKLPAQDAKLLCGQVSATAKNCRNFDEALTAWTKDSSAIVTIRNLITDARGCTNFNKNDVDPPMVLNQIIGCMAAEPVAAR